MNFSDNFLEVKKILGEKNFFLTFKRLKYSVRKIVLWYIYFMKTDKKENLNSIRKSIQRVHLVLIFATTILISAGGIFININSNEKSFDQSLIETSEMINRVYSFIKDFSQDELCDYMDSVGKSLADVDVISIVDKDFNRIYHTNHQLINTKYDGSVPDFNKIRLGFYTENNNGPSGPQRRTYSAFYDENGEYSGFIMTIRLKTSIMMVTIHTVELFLVVTVIAIILETLISGTLFRKIKQSFLSFTEDFEGTKFLVDSMRANNHDFTNKLHVILGLIQIGEYEKAEAYIENISIIQRETVSAIMKAIDNASFSALLIGKICRASECNVKFVLEDNCIFKNEDISIPSEALVTITGNLIDNALDAMNMQIESVNKSKTLTFGVFTKSKNLLITVKDNGPGIPKNIMDKIFEKGFSTKGEGRGVGLFHTKQLIESLGGNISVESMEGMGTKFTVSVCGK